MNNNGKGVQQNDDADVKSYKLQAEQGNAADQFRLGRMYDYGKGVPQDDQIALKWYRLAAEQGHAHSQFIQLRMQSRSLPFASSSV